MAFAYVFGVGGEGALAQGMRDPNTILSGEREILTNIPAFGFAEASGSFYDSLHLDKV